MSNDKTSSSGTRSPSPVPAVSGKARVAGEKVTNRDVEIVPLEVADDDFGGDPYNRTGTHCVLKIDDSS